MTDSGSMYVMKNVVGGTADGLVECNSSSSDEDGTTVGVVRNGRALVVEQNISKSKFRYPVELRGTSLIRDAINNGVIGIKSSTRVEQSGSGTCMDGGKVCEVEEMIGDTKVTTYIGDQQYWESGLIRPSLNCLIHFYKRFMTVTCTAFRYR